MKRFFVLMLGLLMLTTPMAVSAKGDIKQVAKRGLFTDDNTMLPYRLLLPDNYDETKKYPLIIFFHGAGERGDDNELQFFHCVQYIYDYAPEDCIIVAPQCPINNQWVDTPWTAGAYSIDNVPVSNEMVACVGLIEKLKTQHAVDPDRIYAAGLSMGGFAVWDIMTRYNEMFAAGIAVCGSGDPSKAEILKDTPMFVFHGAMDTAVPVSGSRDTVNAIRKAGSTVIEYTEYPEAGHGIWNGAFQSDQLLEKLFACKLSDRIEVEPEESVPEEIESVDESVNESETVSETESKISTKAILFSVLGAILAIAAVVAIILIKKKK